MRLKTLLAILVLHAPVAGWASGLSTASGLSMEGLSTIATAPVLLLEGVSSLTVEAVSASAEGTAIVLMGASEAGEIAFEVSAGALGGSVLTVGQTIEVVASVVGFALLAGDEMIAFIPGETASAMIYHDVHH